MKEGFNIEEIRDPAAQEFIRQLQMEVLELRELPRGGITYPLDKVSQDVVERVTDNFLVDKVMNVQWNDLFYWMTFFDSITGWFIGGTTAIPVDATYQGIAMAVGATNNETSILHKAPLYQNILSWAMQSRFRTGVKMAQFNAAEFYAVVGSLELADTQTHIGFKFLNSSLYGTVANGTAQTTVLLKSGLSNGDAYELEYRFFPKERVVFYMSDPNKSLVHEAGVITTNLPLPTGSADFLYFRLKTLAAVSKSASFSYVEYIQRRARFN